MELSPAILLYMLDFIHVWVYTVNIVRETHKTLATIKTMNKYPRVGSIMFVRDQNNVCVDRVKVLKEDKEVGGVKVVSVKYLKLAKRATTDDFERDIIDSHSYLVNLNSLEK